MDPIDVANGKSIEQFIEDYLPPDPSWRSWRHPSSGAEYSIIFQAATAISASDFESCFELIERTSSDDYKHSKNGWKPRSKRKEMRLLDLKYLLIKRQAIVEGFVSLMPTYEDEYPVIYCYEIHLSTALQGTGLSTDLMKLLEFIGSSIPSISKAMLTCFTRNARAIKFYTKLGYEVDEYSPPPRVLRNGTKVDIEYVILSKRLPPGSMTGEAGSGGDTKDEGI